MTLSQLIDSLAVTNNKIFGECGTAAFTLSGTMNAVSRSLILDSDNFSKRFIKSGQK